MDALATSSPALAAFSRPMAEARPVEIATLEGARSVWRALETEATGSPYQRLDFVAALARSGAVARDALKVLLWRDRTGWPQALLPVVLRRQAGLTIAGHPGGRHANLQMPLLGPGGEDLDLRQALRDAGRALGIDLFRFINVPVRFADRDNPLATEGLPAASDAYGLTLAPDADAVLAGLLSRDARRKLRSKEGKLAAFGPVRLLRSDAPEEIGRCLDTFLRFKAERFRVQGITDPFVEPAIRAFLRDAAVAAPETGRPAIEVHALVAGERVAAVFVAAVDGRSLSGMAHAFDPDPTIARWSPGDLLIAAVIRDACARGFRQFDLGVGEARYKSTFCPERIALREVLIPVTPQGRAVAAALRLAAAAKHAAKRNERLTAGVARLRRVLRSR
jgi:CelD/BcsL family acetyltransferase involved in cellulose biosynthesis